MSILKSLIAWLLGKPVPRPADLPDEVPTSGELAWLVVAAAGIEIRRRGWPVGLALAESA